MNFILHDLYFFVFYQNLPYVLLSNLVFFNYDQENKYGEQI